MLGSFVGVLYGQGLKQITSGPKPTPQIHNLSLKLSDVLALRALAKLLTGLHGTSHSLKQEAGLFIEDRVAKYLPGPCGPFAFLSRAFRAPFAKIRSAISALEAL